VPPSCADDVAVLAQPLAVALRVVRRTRAEPGESVAVIGVGGIGLLTTAVLAARGVEVIAVDIHPGRLAVAGRLGAGNLVNALERGSADAIRELIADGADAVIEASGTAEGLAAALAAVRRGGQVQLVGLQREPQTLDLARLVLDEIEISTSKVHVCEVDLPEALETIERLNLAGVVDSVIELDAVVELGFEALANGNGDGKIVIDLSAVRA
jgi:threonine dehydrogenase-like Zn-dependent dehydrogenase